MLSDIYGIFTQITGFFLNPHIPSKLVCTKLYIANPYKCLGRGNEHMSFNDVIRTFLIYMYFMRGYIRKSSFILHASNYRNCGLLHAT